MEQNLVVPFVKYRGVAFEFGDTILIIPPLSTGQLEEHAETLDKVSEARPYTMKTLGAFLKSNMVPLVHSAVKRNYPDFTVEQTQDFVNSENWGDLVAAMLGNHKGAKVRVGEPFPAVLPGSGATVSSPTSTGDGSGAGLQLTPGGTGGTS